MTSSYYRPDVDGLRALAVVSIILYHLHAMPLPGAFVTLDIFFVISGYLIGAHIARDVERGRFAMGEFYLRRVRRIIPALAVMLAATAIAGVILLYPPALARFGGSLAAAAAAGANLFFWADADYFTPAAQTAPLLHTWSLGVEEQYYLAFPALMLVLYRLLGKQRVWIGLWAILLLSLAVASVVAWRDATLAFYMPYTRMWEFLIGTAIVYAPLDWLERRGLREAVVTAGLALIAGSILLLRTTMPFPGITALPAVLGTAMVIAGGGHGASIGGWLLSIAPAQWIGRISYSLYLWHWPLILFYKQARPLQDLARPDKAALFVTTFVCGALSWRFVEEPFRRSHYSRVTTFGVTAIVLVALAGVGLWFRAGDGLPQRIDPVELRLVGYERSRPISRAPRCNLTEADRTAQFDPTRCLAFDGARPSLLLFGDSHANHLWQALAARSDAEVLEAAAAGCRPLLENRVARNPQCRGLVRATFDFLARERPDQIVLSGRWSAEDLAPLRRTLAWLRAHGQHVILSGPIVEYDASLPVLLALAHRRDDPDLPQRHRVAKIAAVDTELAALARDMGVRYWSPYRALCPGHERCVTMTPAGVPVQHDYGHLTMEGADYLVARLLAGR